MFSIRIHIVIVSLAVFLSLKGYAQNNAIFTGGVGSGFGMSCHAQADAVLNNNIFRGGFGSGVGMNCHAQADAVLNNNIFRGGIGSGFFLSCLGTFVQVPLPIELLFFTAFVQINSVLLEWATASETNNDFFTIERSKNGLEWEIVSRVEGAGNSSVTIHYSSIDYQPYTGISYYRLKQTDFDGQYEYSRIIAVNLNKESNVNIYPNPASDKFYIITPDQLEYEITILDVHGRIVFHGFNSKVVSTLNFSAGLYIVRITCKAKETKIFKLIVN